MPQFNPRKLVWFGCVSIWISAQGGSSRQGRKGINGLATNSFGGGLPIEDQLAGAEGEAELFQVVGVQQHVRLRGPNKMLTDDPSEHAPIPVYV